MKIISFAWTTPAIKARRKSVTRREWNPEYAARFMKGELLTGYDRSPRFKGKPICKIRLLDAPQRQWSNHIPESDWEAEGFAYLESIGAKCGWETPRGIWENWRSDPILLYVVRFAIVEVFNAHSCSEQREVSSGLAGDQ